jgi:hypothetical protein
MTMKCISIKAMSLALAIQLSYGLLPEKLQASLSPTSLKVITITILALGIVGRVNIQKKSRNFSK